MKQGILIFIMSLIATLIVGCRPGENGGRADGPVDLTISSYRVNYTSECPWGGPGEVTVTISNTGSGDADAFSVEINHSRVQVEGVPAGSSTTATITFSSGPVGTVNATADIDEEVSESDETNNNFMIAFTPPPPCEEGETADPAGQPDLAIAFHNITYSDECAWGSEGEISVQVNNLGAENTDAFQVSINGTLSTVSGIPAGGSATASAQFNEGPVGSIEIIADPENQIAESDENNNTYMLVFTPPARCEDL